VTISGNLVVYLSLQWQGFAASFTEIDMIEQPRTPRQGSRLAQETSFTSRPIRRLGRPPRQLAHDDAPIQQLTLSTVLPGRIASASSSPRTTPRVTVQ
jgi:hypothetical protein